MIFLPVSSLIVTFVAVKAFAEVLNCYECDDCKTPNETVLRACQQAVTTTTTPEILVTSTTVIPETSTTATSFKATTTVLPASTTATSFKATTTVLPASTSAEPVDVTAPADLEPETTLPTLTTPNIQTTISTEDNNDETTVAVLKRSARYVNYRSLMVRRLARESEVNYHCYSLRQYGDNRKKIKKGCVEVIGNKKPCDVLAKEYNVTADNCLTCNADKCNKNAAKTLHSYSYVILAFLISCFCYRNLNSF